MAHENKNRAEIAAFLDKFQFLWGKINVGTVYVGAVMLIVCVLSICSGMVSREFFGKAAAWTYELAGYAVVYCTFACVPYLFWKKGHVIIDLLVGKMSLRQKRIHSIVVLVVSMVCAFMIFWFGINLVIDYFSKGVVMMSTVPWPKGLLFLPIPVTFFITFVQMLIGLLGIIFLNGTIFPEDDIPSAPGQ